METLDDYQKQILRCLSSAKSILGRPVPLSSIRDHIYAENGGRDFDDIPYPSSSTIQKRIDLFVGEGYVIHKRIGTRRQHLYEITEKGDQLATRIRTPGQQRDFLVTKPAITWDELSKILVPDFKTIGGKKDGK